MEVYTISEPPSQAGDLRAAMRFEGLQYEGPIIADGRLRRFKAEGDKDRNSWYVVFPGEHLAGAFGCWKRGLKRTYHQRNGRLSAAEYQRLQAQWREADEIRKKTEAELQERARKTAQWLFVRCEKDVLGHAYTSSKRVQVHGDVRLSSRGELVLPLRDSEGCLHSLQFISSARKLFLKHARCSGAFFTLCDKPEGPLVF